MSGDQQSAAVSSSSSQQQLKGLLLKGGVAPRQQQRRDQGSSLLWCSVQRDCGVVKLKLPGAAAHCVRSEVCVATGVTLRGTAAWLPPHKPSRRRQLAPPLTPTVLFSVHNSTTASSCSARHAPVAPDSLGSCSAKAMASTSVDAQPQGRHKSNFRAVNINTEPALEKYKCVCTAGRWLRGQACSLRA